jgi:ribosomal protein S18 acetylase RimI-like enzyme
MLWLAVHWDAVQAPPPPDPLPVVLVPYVDGFGRREGDFGVIAEHGAGAAGAAWYRLFSANEPGYGFVSSDVPELSVAVIARLRSGGVGSALLERLVESARVQGRPGLSLSVRRQNPARALYERMGFEAVGSVDDSLTMLLRFGPTTLC